MDNKNQLLELKAQAYDLLARIQFMQQELNRVNSQIGQLSQMPVAEQDQNKK
jgi:hypothetical protein